MFRPQIQKTRILVLLTIINLSMVYIAHITTYKVDSPYREEKEAAAEIMNDALKVLKEKIRPQYKELGRDQLEVKLGKRGIEFDHLDYYCLYTKESKQFTDSTVFDWETCFTEHEGEDPEFDYKRKHLKDLLKEDDEDKLQVIYKAIDPNLTGLISIGNSSPILTGRGNLEAKQTTLKTDFAALIIDQFINTGLIKGDTVAVGMTGSMPGANIALLSACKALDIHPVIISSIGASEWGAADTNFLWIDMEQTLKQDFIFNNISIAYSPGGRGDCLRPQDEEDRNKQREGLEIFEDKINLYNAEKVAYNSNNANNLWLSVEKRWHLYGHSVDNIENYKAYVNIGGGAASIGIGGGDIFGTPGYLTPQVVKNLTNDEHYSVIKKFADHQIPTIHISHIRKLAKGNLSFGYPINEKTGKLVDNLVDDNQLYEQIVESEYKLIIHIITLLVSLGSVIYIGIISHNQIKRRMHSYEPESIL